MSNEPPIVELRLCSACGAACDVTKPVCWMCSGRLPLRVPRQAANRGSISSDGSSGLDSVFFALLIACMSLAVLVGLGIAADAPGALVAYLFIIVPAFAVTGVRALWQVHETGRAQPGKLVVSFLVSFVVTVGIVVILAVAAAVLLFVMCLQALTGSH